MDRMGIQVSLFNLNVEVSREIIRRISYHMPQVHSNQA
jgi:hypothetical protein